MSIIRFLLVFLIVSLPFGAYAQSGLLDATSTLSELQLLIAQYDARIKKLESENALLRYQMAKAGIQIPLEEMTGATNVTIPTALTPTTTAQSGTTISTSTTAVSSSSLTEITTKYGKDVAGFISQINKDWTAIRTNYKFPSNAKLAGYEFVQTGAMDYVFADIVIGTGATSIYDIKVLYQFEKTAYKRKLIGIFDYNSSTARYITRTGTNPFGGVARTFVKDPYYGGAVETPATAISPTTTVAIPTSSGTTSTLSTTSSGSVTLAEITKAYNEKRYLSTISLSNTYLASNPATQEILNIRYRTYFIIGKYAESLAELAKIEKIVSIDKQTACNAQVIATYSKNQSLVDKYATICKK